MGGLTVFSTLLSLFGNVIKHRRFHGRGRHFGSGANTAKFTVNV